MDTFQQWLGDQGLSPNIAQLTALAGGIFLVLLLAWLVGWVGRRFFAPFLEAAVQKSENHWDDALHHQKFFQRFFRLPPVVILYSSADLLFPPDSITAELIRRLAMTLFVLVGVWVLNSLLQAAHDIYGTTKRAKEKTIRAYLDAIRITIFFLAGVFVVAILTDKSPYGILSVLGGFTVILMLVFKDTILGFVAGIQLSANDMVRVGDWLEMPKFGADGDVIDISIHTVKVQNWDKTISTIPTYALVNNSFKNWRGMSESGGRRIKRSLHIDMHSIYFCDQTMLEKFSRFELLKEYLEDRKKEIADHNRKQGLDESQIINGRRQTNIGVFRAYIVAYLRNHPKIHQDMTFLIRHLQPTAQGLPVQIYVFSNDQVWANYEAIQADIFDHLLAAVPEFGLRIFQYPSGHDLANFLNPTPS